PPASCSRSGTAAPSAAGPAPVSSPPASSPTRASACTPCRIPRTTGPVPVVLTFTENSWAAVAAGVDKRSRTGTYCTGSPNSQLPGDQSIRPREFRMSDVLTQVHPESAPLPPAVPPAERPPRLWPAAVVIALMWLAIQVPALVAPGTFVTFMFLMYAPMVAGVALAVWLLFFSRLRWLDRVLVLVAFIGLWGASQELADISMP